MYGLVMYGLRYAVLSLNTRVRRGRDRHDKGASDARGVSTHASAGDATAFCNRSIVPFDVSTHASAGDATGMTRQRCGKSAFQLTRPRGTRRGASRRGQIGGDVSTHASAGDATFLSYR